MPSLKALNLTGNKLTGCLPQSLVERSRNGTLLLSVEADTNFCMTTARKTNNKSKKLLLLVIPVSVVVLISGSLAFLWMFKRNGQAEHNNETLVLDSQDNNEEAAVKPRKREYTSAEVKDITNNCANRIGNGGYGIVYKGKLDGKEVAVKILSKTTRQGIKTIQCEVEVLMDICHKNLVKLIGYSNEGLNKALIYEYMENGDLKKHLSETNSNVLSWRKRLQIALDAAQGLNYLHNECPRTIVHRDLKTANILLDENWQAKLADFGLSRIFATEKACHVSTNPGGTPGYMDLESFRSGKFNKKSDVYSFGIVILELITGRPAVIEGSDPDEDAINILEWFRPLHDQGNVFKFVDPKLPHDQFNPNSVLEVAHVAMKCTKPRSEDRLDIREVITKLEASLAVEMAPAGRTVGNSKGSTSVKFNLHSV